MSLGTLLVDEYIFDITKIFLKDGLIQFQGERWFDKQTTLSHTPDAVVFGEDGILIGSMVSVVSSHRPHHVKPGWVTWVQGYQVVGHTTSYAQEYR